MNARSRDRRVYLGSHPMLFALLAATRRWPTLRLGGTLLVHDRAAFTAGLTRIPLDRTAEGTTGGAASRLTGGEVLFDQHGDAHRQARRGTADALGAAGVARLRPVWTEVLDRGLKPLADGDPVDLVPLAAELAGTTAAALLDLDVDGTELAAAARAAGATAARAHLPGRRRRRAGDQARQAATRLSALVAPGGGPDAGLATMLAVAAINTTVAALPRAAAWAADADLWGYAASPALADELLRVTAPTPLLPRVAAAPGCLPTSRTSASSPGRCPDRSHAGSSPGRWSDRSHTGSSPGRCPDRSGAGASADRIGPGAGTGRPGPASAGSALGCPVRAGDRMLLIARHAVDAHHLDPDPESPAPAQIAQLVFGAGPHACPGARLARTQLTDLLVALAPKRPTVVRARVDRRAALPGWRSLIVRAS